MSVPEQMPIVTYQANGTTTAFPIPFDFHDSKYLIVTVNKEIPLVGAYTIENNTVIFSESPNDGDEITLARDTTLDRETNYQKYDNSFRPEAVNYDFDKIWHVLQEQNLIDGKLLARLKEEIEWRRTHDANFDELSKMRDAQIFSGLKQYLDTVIASATPNIFEGITAGIVFALDKKSIQTHIENILGQLEVKANVEDIYFKDHVYTKTETTQLIESKADKTYVENSLSNLSTLANKFYPTLQLANADIANISVSQAVTIGDATDGGVYYKESSTSTSLKKSNYDPLNQAKNYVHSLATVKAKTIANGSDFNTIIDEGTRIVPSNAAALTMINCPSTRAGVLEVLGISPTLTIQRYTPYGIDKQIFYRASNTSVWPETWDEILLKSEAINLFATPTSVSSAIGSSVDSITQSAYYGKKYSTSELSGSQLYINGAFVGYNSIYDKDTSFNALEARIFNATSDAVEFRVWIGSKVINGANGYQVSSPETIANPDFSGVCKSFPRSDTGLSQQIVLDKVVSIPANTPFVIAFRAVDTTRFSIAYASTATGNLESRSFNLNQMQGDWSALTAIGNASIATYIQAGFKLLVSIPQASSSGGGSTEQYTPNLVLPPKVYAVAGLETHIYPEHLLVEDHKLYEHDITCTRGSQRVRGYVWTPTASDPIGSYPLTWALHDKQKGLQVTSDATTIQLAALNAKSGQTVKVLVIGDSLVNAGSITQRLLDIAENDVMKVQLLGIRGAGANKHEGRGGWKISDYATAGRSDYKFTVSSVTTAPAINSTTYAFDGRTYIVQEVSAGYIVASLYGGAPPSSLGVSGTLTKANSGLGDTAINFTNLEAVPSNPFWNLGTSSLDFSRYLSVNSLAIPDYVFIQLGVNDVFAFTSDQAVIDFTENAFSQLDALISSIKVAAPSVKVAVVASPIGANQDAFGTSYGCGQTAWRYRRNLVTYNKQLYTHYAGKEAQKIYVLGSGVNVDTENNFPTTTAVINSHNSTSITSQNNGVHPDASGYLQIGDGWFSFMKVV